MMESLDSLKDKVLQELGGDDAVIAAFSNISFDQIQSNMTALVRAAVQDKSPEVRQHALRELVTTITEVQVNPSRVRLILQVISTVTKDNIVSPKEVIEHLKDLLNTDIENLTLELLDFFNDLITTVDYKINKEIFVICLQETHKLSSVMNGAHIRTSRKLIVMLTRLLNRQSLLLPPICCYSDIIKSFDKANVTPHFTVAELMNRFLSSFNHLSQLLTVENVEWLKPVVRHSLYTQSNWRLDQQTLTFSAVNSSVLKFSGPYSQPQDDLLLYTLKLPFCRDLVFTTMLGLRQNKSVTLSHLEKAFLRLIKDACVLVEKQDPEGKSLWNRIGSELSFFIFSNAVNIKTLATSLYSMIKNSSQALLYQKNRDYIMWTLSRYISFSLKVLKMPKKDLLFVGELIKLLYNDAAPLPLPSMNHSSSVIALSAASVWALFAAREGDGSGLKDVVPIALRTHIEWLQKSTNAPFSIQDFTIAACCNFNSSNQLEQYSKPQQILMEFCFHTRNSPQYTTLPGNVQAHGAINPLPMELLDSLTAHSKMSFMLYISNYITKNSDNRETQTALAPALVETYSRLLSYSEIDFVSVKMVITLIATVFSNHAFGILSGLIEMFSYRMQYMKQTFHRVQMLSNLQQLAGLSQSAQLAQPQLLYLAESCTTRLLFIFNHYDLNVHLSKLGNGQVSQKMVSSCSEELNKVFVLTIARTFHVSGNKNNNNWLNLLMTNILKATPHTWSSYTLKHFPPCLTTYYNNNTDTNQQQLYNTVNDELSRLHGNTGLKYKEHDPSNLFLCLMLRLTMDQDKLPGYAPSVISTWAPPRLKQQIRNMLDYLVCEVKYKQSNHQDRGVFTKVVNAVNDFIFKYHIFPIDTFLLIAALRRYSDQDATIPFFLIYHLLAKKTELKQRVEFFTAHAKSNFWQQNDWHSAHMRYHVRYPEHEYFINPDMHGQNNQYLPLYFSNICLRVIPVLDIVIHRMIELSPPDRALNSSRQWLTDILTIYAGLYSFHDAPITFLHNTLHYYEQSLAQRDSERKSLIRAVLQHRALSKEFTDYMGEDNEGMKWSPNYYSDMLTKLTACINGTISAELQGIDWRFNEFSNPACFLLHLTAIELMALPVPAYGQRLLTTLDISQHKAKIGSELIEVVLASKASLAEWSNTLALLFSALPCSFSAAMFSKIGEVLADSSNYGDNNKVDNVQWNYKAQSVLVLAHSFFQHSKLDKMSLLPDFLQQHIPSLTTEGQVVYLLKLISPFMHHMVSERSPAVQPTLRGMYQAIFNLLSEVGTSNPDLFVDFMYFCKYIFVGDEMRPVIEQHLKGLPADIASKMKFLVQGTEVLPAKTSSS